MDELPRMINHPTFGRCELIPSLVAIKWKAPIDRKEVESVLSSFGLSLADEARQSDRSRTRDGRDPAQPTVNQTTMLSWAKGGRLSDAKLGRIKESDNVEWIAGTYRATRADKGPQSYFTINPTSLVLTKAAAAALGDVTSIEPSAFVDDRRTQLLKGFVVINLPNGNAIEVAAKIRKSADDGGVLFENIPYLKPISPCSCGGGSPVKGTGHSDCSPSTNSIIPNDTFFTNQWGLQRINAPLAWPLSEGDPNVVIAVLDEGVELGHPDLNMWPISYSTITHTNDGSPVGNHGTACAGIIGARIDNSTGVSGLAGKCRIMAIATHFADTEVAEGLYFAADNGARIVSMSFGVYPSWMMWNFAIIEAALQYCHEKNVVLVAATGNEDQGISRFPATDPRTIGVGGSNRDDVRKAIGDTSIESWWGACYGPDVDVVAPCLEIPTTDRLAGAGYTPTDYDQRFNGTSAATPHVAGLAGLIISVNPALTASEVRQIISQTTDKINVGSYTYLPTAGKPYGTWNDQVGYGRINVERAVLVACSSAGSKDHGPCGVDVPTPEDCCVSPCDPPWRPDQQCMVWYEERFLRQPIVQRDNAAVDFARSIYIEFRITYEHKLCLLGKQQGPLIYTVTLLPGEKVTLYHSDRYRHITSTQDRFSVQTTFMQFFSSIQQARVTNTLDTLSERLSSVKSSASGSFGGGLGDLLGLPSGSASISASVTDHNLVRVGFVSDQFNQTIVQASQLTHAERSVVVSTFEERETADISARTIQNDNACRAVTYFVRRVVELYAFSTRVSGVAYRVIAPNVPSDWHSLNDVAWLPAQIQQQIKAMAQLLPKVGDVTEQPKAISLPTDGTVYNPELANCCSCEPERAAAIEIQLERQKAEARKLCLDAELLQLEVERRRLLLKKGELAAFGLVATPVPAASLPDQSPRLLGAPED